MACAPIWTHGDERSSSPRRPRAPVFEDPRSRELLAETERIAPSEAPVLVTGETGTGKEIVARLVHEQSARRHGPFVAVNCGALSESLIESELFGHERGAFTGASIARAGWFEAAAGGTLFLDEIGDLPPAMQVKLLRVLQEREVVRVGSRHAIAVDVRLVAATNVALAEAVTAGRFRADLYYRLHVATLRVPPLRERPGDVVPLARCFLADYAERAGRGGARLDPSAEARLLEHAWPGNVRELENVIHHAALVCTGAFVRAADLRVAPVAHARAPEPPVRLAPFAALDAALSALLDDDTPALHAAIEERLFRAAYAHAEQNQLQTARLLGISRNVVRARLQAYGLLSGGRHAPPVSSITRSITHPIEEPARLPSSLRMDR